MIEIVIVALFVTVLLLAWVAWRIAGIGRDTKRLAVDLAQALEDKHRLMLTDLHAGLTQQGERVGTHLADSSERLRGVLAEELRQTRDTLHAMRLALTQDLAQSREAVAQKLGETTQALTAKVEERLEQISGKVGERLDEGFKKTNETFVSVMQRLATIDEAQKKIEGLTGSVVSLQELLGDKRSRGAFGEVQLEALVRNVLPASAFELQYTLSNGSRADCVLKLPEPTGLVAVDSKFPLENYHRMFGADANAAERSQAQKAFKQDVRRHVDAIAGKYIVADETSDGAVMFVPAEAVFAEIHAYHADLVDYAMSRRVWIVSPTTLMAVLNTARAVLRDVETRKQVHVIQDALVRLGADFRRFEDRMKKLADHIRLAHQDAEEVQTSSRKITQQFAKIESAQIESAPVESEQVDVAPRSGDEGPE